MRKSRVLMFLGTAVTGLSMIGGNWDCDDDEDCILSINCDKAISWASPSQLNFLPSEPALIDPFEGLS